MCPDVSLGFLAALVHLVGRQTRETGQHAYMCQEPEKTPCPAQLSVGRLPAVIKLRISAWALRWALSKESKRMSSKISENLKRRFFCREAKMS